MIAQAPHLPEKGPLAGAIAMLRTPPPEVDSQEAEDALHLHWGRRAFAHPLPGERDRNFLMEDGDGWSAVLKFYHGSDDAPTRDLQHGAMIHIRGRDPSVPVPSVLPSQDGRLEVRVEKVGREPQAAVLITRRPGRPVRPSDLRPRLRRNLGAEVGRLSRALADYRHPMASRTILWDSMRLPHLRPLLGVLSDPTQAETSRALLDRFEQVVAPAAARLPRQPIHNDLSLSNVLVDEADPGAVSGLIDFGDLVEAPRINELAVAASYFVPAEGDPAEALSELLDGYAAAVLPTRAEVELLPDLVQARLVTRLLLSEWRARLFPLQTDYILRSNRSAWALLTHLAPRPSEEVAADLLRLWPRSLP